MTDTQTEVGHEQAAGSSGGMPQLDPSSFSSQLFWLAATFIILYVLLAKWALPRIQSVLTQREQHIKADLDAADAAKFAAQEAKRAYEKEHREARDKANALLNAAQNNISSMMANEQAALDKKLDDEMNQLQATITGRMASFNAAIEPEIATLAGLIVERLTGQKPADNTIASSVSLALKDAR